MGRFLLLAVLALFASVFISLNFGHEAKGVIIVAPKGEIYAEVADSPGTRARGLMWRGEVCGKCGMLFVFEEEAERRFWMKNTLVPLDMVFLDANFSVVKVRQAQPCKESVCEYYSSGAPAKYVVEVAGGGAQRLGIEEGVQLRIGERGKQQ